MQGQISKKAARQFKGKWACAAFPLVLKPCPQTIEFYYHRQRVRETLSEGVADCVRGAGEYLWAVLDLLANAGRQITVTSPRHSLPLPTPIRVGTCKTAATANLIIYHFAAGQQQKII